MLALIAALATQPAPAPTPAPAERLIHWDGETDGNPKSYLIGGLRLTIAARFGEGSSQPILTLASQPGERFRHMGAEGLPHPRAEFGMFRLDPANPVPQVVLQTFTGGAHCCEQIEVLERLGGRWKALPVGWFEGEISDRIRDVDGDGVRDIVLEDDRFAYAFASFAASYMPPMIFNVRGGRVWNVSAEPRYARVYETDMQRAQKSCEEGGTDSNGACAAFVADAARLGRLAWAWKIMLKSYDRTSTWFPTKCRVARVNGACPKGKEVTFKSFPEALDWFLHDAGYIRAPGRPATEPVRVSPQA